MSKRVNYIQHDLLSDYGGMKLEVKVFYSWQSDIKAASNRTLIQGALEAAVKDIRNDDSINVEPVIDRDTYGVSGSPDISSTIFAKIDNCQIFVADISIINSGSKNRPTPNPNVLIELGYAIKTVDWNQIILVQNVAYGNPELLPFDLRQRRILTYNSPENAESRKAERSKLQSVFFEAISSMVQELEQKPANDYSAVLRIERIDKQTSTDNHEYELRVTLENNGSKNIHDWHVDLVFPTILLKPSVKYSRAVASRSDEKETLFRSSQNSHPGVIYPGDHKLVLTIDYRMNDDIYWNHQEVYKQTVKATAYVHDEKVATLEKDMEPEILNF
jgi:hypothetical protein